MLSTSAQAPAGWRVDQSEATIRQRVLVDEIDVVCFQELPGAVPFIETHGLAPANTISHSGTIATLVRNELLSDMVCRAVGRFAVVCVFPQISLTIANVHLASGQGVAAQRLAQIQRLVEICPTKSLLIAGDTNLRVSEEQGVFETGLHGRRPPRPTWDSRINQFSREKPNRFMAYFTRYFHTATITVSDVKVFDRPLEQDGKAFFLSDHFALSGTVRPTE